MMTCCYQTQVLFSPSHFSCLFPFSFAVPPPYPCPSSGTTEPFSEHPALGSLLFCCIRKLKHKGMAGRRTSPLDFTGMARSDETASGRGRESPWLPSKLVTEPEELRRSLDIKATFLGGLYSGCELNCIPPLNNKGNTVK